MARGLRGFGKYQSGALIEDKPIREHVLVAQAALGRKLPVGALVHHVDGDRSNNKNSNLVICPNEGYHNLLHIRAEALESCGNPNYRKCPFCGKWDSPDNLLTKNKQRPSPQAYHRQCRHDYYIRKKNGRRLQD